MTESIYKKIEAKGQEEVFEILAKADSEAEKISNSIINKAQKAADARVKRAEDLANRDIAHKERLLDLEKRQALLISKQNIIDGIFDKVLEKLQNLEGEDLLNYVEKLIKSQEIIGDEIFRTNKTDYDKYLKALSTNKKDILVELDLLNKKLKTNFKISNESINIKNGFILEGKYFDLNFSLDQIVQKLRDKNQKAIAKELFE